MTQPTFDFSTLFDTYKTAMAPVFRAQQEGLKTLERLAHYQFAVAGDYLEWSLAQAKASVGPKSAAELIGQQTTLNLSLSDKLRARAEEFSKIATSFGAFALVLQAGIIAAVLMNNRPSTFETASLSTNEPVTRSLSAASSPRALVRFAPDARIGDIMALLDKYQASIVGGATGGMFRLQFANGATSKDEFANLLSRLQNEKIVSLAVATP